MKIAFCGGGGARLSRHPVVVVENTKTFTQSSYQTRLFLSLQLASTPPPLRPIRDPSSPPDSSFLLPSIAFRESRLNGLAPHSSRRERVQSPSFIDHEAAGLPFASPDENPLQDSDQVTRQAVTGINAKIDF